MNIEVGEKGKIVLTEVYNEICLKSNYGVEIHIAERDTGFEIYYKGDTYIADKEEKKLKKLRRDRRKKKYGKTTTPGR